MTNKNVNEDNESKMNINWYPGHMLKTKKQIIEDLKLIDVIIEILDARIPISSQNPDIQKLTKEKKKVILLNKSDLAEARENKKWIEYFKQNNIIAVETDLNSGKGIKDCLNKLEESLKETREKAIKKGRINKSIRVMIIGVPNVGKSSLINRIANKKSAQVGNRPGVTKQKQWVRISNNIELLDTPGVLWPKLDNEEVALNLAYTGTIKQEVLPIEDVAYSLLKKLYNLYKSNLFDRYKITKEEENEILKQEDIILSLMEIIAKKRGAIISKGEIDYTKISEIILTDFKTGKLGRITLEKVNEK